MSFDVILQAVEVTVKILVSQVCPVMYEVSYEWLYKFEHMVKMENDKIY